MKSYFKTLWGTQPSTKKEKLVGDYRCQFGHGHIGVLRAVDCEKKFLNQQCEHKWGEWEEKGTSEATNYVGLGGPHYLDRLYEKYKIYIQCRKCGTCGLNEYSEHRVFLGKS